MGKAVVVGGSIAGISCAHSLIAAGWDVVVLEKTCSPPSDCATGAGLGLDTVSLKLIQSWIKQPQLLQLLTLPMTIEHVSQIFLHSKPAKNCLYGLQFMEVVCKSILKLRNYNCACHQLIPSTCIQVAMLFKNDWKFDFFALYA